MSRWKSWAISMLELALCATVAYAAPEGMVLIPEGTFQMGDAMGVDSGSGYSELPVHGVYVSAFYMDKTEVTWGKWQEVCAWAATAGYELTGAGATGMGEEHPVHAVNWYDAVKWCNARSEMEGLTPCYYVNGGIYRQKMTNDVVCAWAANGYRLPSEAEWERAARGGEDGHRFAWHDAETIDHTRANYTSGWAWDLLGYNYDLAAYGPSLHNWQHGGYHPLYRLNSGPFTSPVGAFPHNAFGLYDMVGNVAEWCWDAMRTYTADSVVNPHGSDTLYIDYFGHRWSVYRGGSWDCWEAEQARVSVRGETGADAQYNALGFRAARTVVSQPTNEAPVLQPIKDVRTYVGRTVSIAVTASDPNGDVPSYSAVGLPSGASFTNGLFTWMPSSEQVGSHTIDFVASDDVLEDSASVSISVVPPTATMVFVPAGTFQVGDAFNEGELPVQTLYISDFHIDRYEVNKALWDEVRAWAIVNGYSINDANASRAGDHPVVGMRWYDCIAWCNARSEMEGLQPCYYKDTAKTIVYRSGSLDFRCDYVDWTANGYRLPTDAEWEKAARGGAEGRRFAWADSDAISHQRANFFNGYVNGSGGKPYAEGPLTGYHLEHNALPLPLTCPVGSFEPNGYGLYDVIGNAGEWCWAARPSDGYYDMTDPQCYSGLDYAVVCNGGWNSFDEQCRVAYRNVLATPYGSYIDVGFRTVRCYQEVVNQAPALDAIGDKSVLETKTLSFTVTASDPDGDTLDLSATPLPAGASFEDGEFSWTPTDEQAGSYSVTFTVSDGELSDSETITIAVADYAMAPIVMEAEAMPFKSNGLQLGDCWALLGTGRIEQNVAMPFSGIYDIQIDAWGTPAGDGPVMVLTVDGVQKSSFMVNATNLAAYSVPVELQGGSHTVAVEFVNDNGSRDLMIDKVTVALELPDVVRVMEAEAMAFKSNGETWWGIWGLYGVGYVEEPMQVAEAGVYEVTVRAYGRYSSGEWPTMIMLVDGVEVSHVSVDSADWQEFTFRVALAAGERDLGVKFVNDNGPRDLFLDKLVVAKMPAEAVHFVEAENMDYKSSGGAWWGVWGLWGVGQVREPVQIAQAGAYDLVVRARGTYSAGWPLMVVSVDGVDVSSFNVNSTDWADYTVSTELSAGEHTVAIKFLNDYGPRDLILDHMAAIPADNVLRALEVERMPFKSNGDTWWGIWGLYGTGYVQDSLVVPASGTYAFSVRAYGSQAGGVWPLMELRVDQTPVAVCTVGSADWAEYVAEVELTEGSHTVEAAFLNDGWIAPDDRNLYLDRVKISVVE